MRIQSNKAVTDILPDNKTIKYSNKGNLQNNLEQLKKATENNLEKFKTIDPALVSKEDSQDVQIASEIEELSEREQSIIKHELAHMLVGGGMAGSPSFVYTLGPDGRKYVSGGNVSLRLPKGGSYDQLLRDLKRVKAAATAPMDPSPQDMNTAAMATAMELSIKKEYTVKQAKEAYEKQKEFSKPIEKLNGKDRLEQMIEATYTSALSKMKFKTMASFEMLI